MQFFFNENKNYLPFYQTVSVNRYDIVTAPPTYKNTLLLLVTVQHYTVIGFINTADAILCIMWFAHLPYRAVGPCTLSKSLLMF